MWGEKLLLLCCDIILVGGEEKWRKGGKGVGCECIYLVVVYL